MRKAKLEVSTGEVEYRLPSYMEISDIMEAGDAWNDPKLTSKQKFKKLEGMTRFIESLSLDLEGHKVSSWDELKQHPEALEVITSLLKALVSKIKPSKEDEEVKK